MSNEFKHDSVGAELSQAEWEAMATHIADGQTTGDILYFNGTYWVRTNILFIDGTNSRVGINTSSPACKLHINNSSGSAAMRISATTYAEMQWFDGGGSSCLIDSIYGNWNGLTNPFVIQTSGKPINFSTAFNTPAQGLTIDTSGHVGIGKISPSYMLDMEASGGGYYSAADHQWHNGSSRRWKENIIPLASGLDLIKRLNPVSFDWKLFDPVKKDEAGKVVSGTGSWITGGKKDQLGFIAEEVGGVLPDIADWSKDDGESADSYSQASIIAVAVKAIQELAARIEKLEVK
jgi:hypothetical protein